MASVPSSTGLGEGPRSPLCLILYPQGTWRRGKDPRLPGAGVASLRVPAGGVTFPQTSLGGSSSQNTPDPEAGLLGNALHQRLWPHLVARGQRGTGG